MSDRTVDYTPNTAAHAPIRAGELGHHVRRIVRRPEFGAAIGLMVVYAFFFVVAMDKGFVSLPGTAGWLNTAAQLGIIAIPVAMLMIGGEFDLSIGSVIGATSILVSALTTTLGVPLGISILSAVGLGVLVGLFNGILTIRTRLPSFIVTLVSMLSVAGLALGFSRLVAGAPLVSLHVEGPLRMIFAAKWNFFNVSILWWMLVAGIAAWVLLKTKFGNWIYATGGDLNAAREAGVPTDRVKVILFVCTALGAVLIGVSQAIEFNGGEATRGQAYLFNSIIACIIGGVLLNGGYGSVLGVTLGTMTYGIVNIGIYYTGWNSDWAQLFLGGLLLAAVLTNNLLRKLALTS